MLAMTKEPNLATGDGQHIQSGWVKLAGSVQSTVYTAKTTVAICSTVQYNYSCQMLSCRSGELCYVLAKDQYLIQHG